MGRIALLLLLVFIARCISGAEWAGEERSEHGVDYQCKCYSDHACWPDAAAWTALNTTVEGSLHVALPPGAVCHSSIVGEDGNVTTTYDQAACEEVQANWDNEQWLTDHPVANLWPLYTNNSCLPASSPGGACTRGFYGDYVILATSKAHLKAGVDFARDHNLRLVVRNTGHDFMGRSTGYGSLVLNTHRLKDIAFVKSYTGPGNWTGSAAMVGAGVQGLELYREAFAQDPPVVVVGGECPTVGWAGGYIQGGGHGPLSSIYGMGADSVLAFDAITAAGEYVVASAVEHPDLFWALKGGGPSTFAIVTSVTVKTHPEIPTAGTILNINATHTNDSDVFREAFRIFHNLSNHYTDHGMFAYFELSPGRLHVAPLVGPNMDAAGIREVLQPLFDQLEAADIPYDAHTKAFPTFFELYTDMFEDEIPNQNSVVGGRLFTRMDIAERGAAVADAIVFASAPTAEDIGFSIGHIVNPGYGVPVADNAIHPKWRNASSFVISNVWMDRDGARSVKEQKEHVQTNIIGKALRAAGPDGASYVNEGDLFEPHWQTSYWGSNYPRLLKSRKKWDPQGVFYAQTTPGTEDWTVLRDGKRLCKKKSPALGRE